MSLFGRTHFPDKKLPVYGNEDLRPIKSNVNYNHRPVQQVNLIKNKYRMSYNTSEMNHYTPIENGGIK